jgi:protein-tyrosine-phosphatase
MVAHLLRQAHPDWEVKSRGTFASVSTPTPKRWRDLVGYDWSPELPQRISESDVAWADVIVGFQKSHIVAAGSIDSSKKLVHWPVEDPAFVDREEWGELYANIANSIPDLVSRIEEA